MEILYFFALSNDPDPAADATIQWKRLELAGPTKGESSPDRKYLLVDAEDEMSHAYVDEMETSQAA